MGTEMTGTKDENLIKERSPKIENDDPLDM